MTLFISLKQDRVVVLLTSVNVSTRWYIHIHRQKTISPYLPLKLSSSRGKGNADLESFSGRSPLLVAPRLRLTSWMKSVDRLFLLRVHICKWLLTATCRSLFILKIAGRTFGRRWYDYWRGRSIDSLHSVLALG